MTFRNRLITGFIGIVALITAFSILIYSLGSSLEHKLDKIMENRYAKLKLAQHVLTDAGQIQNQINLSLLNRSTQWKEEELESLCSGIKRNFEELRTLSQHSPGTAMLDKAEVSYAIYEKGIHAASTRLSGQSADADAPPESIYHLETLQKAFTGDLQKYIDLQEGLMLANSNDAMGSLKQFKLMILGFWLLMVVLTLLIGTSAMHGALRSIRRISDTMDGFDSEHSGALKRIPVDSKDEINDIARAYNRMADSLEERENREKDYQNALEQENWVKTHLAEVASIYQDNRDVSLFCARLLSKLVPLTGGVCASLYVLDRSHETLIYSRRGAYAWGAGASRSVFAPGEGLVGQCAAEGKMIRTTVPEHYVKIRSGSGSASPTHLLFLPIPHNDEIIAVLELASFEPVDGSRLTLLTDIANHSLGTTIRNIQYQKHVEKLYAESQSYNEELQIRSEELLLQQEALRTLNERLEEQVNISEMNSRYKSEFLANMSHELRTPLNSLLVLAQILRENKEGNLTKRQIEYADTMVMSGNQLLTLINDILDLSKIEAGQMTASSDSFSLKSMLEELSQQFVPLMEEKELAFSVFAEPELYELELTTDKQRLQQILRNLLSNALKFTDAGSVSLRVRVLADDPLTLGFAITDTGIGIAQEDQKSIFEAFKQVEGNTSRKYGGTGLGLAISQELARLVGGRISVNSAPFSGSTFLLSLPLHSNLMAGQRQAAPALAIVPGLTPLSGRTFTIMLVDDDMRNIYSVSSVLEDYGYEVICAANGAEALALLGRQPVDLILMDIMMPELDGCETMRRIRLSADHGKVPIIALTAKAMEKDRELCLEAGANDYISKPAKLDKLLSVIRSWLPEAQTV